MSDNVIVEEEKLNVIRFEDIDYFNEVNRFYDILLKLYEDEIKGEKTILTEEDINVLCNSTVYANALSISAITSLSHLYEKLKVIVEQRNKKGNVDFIAEYDKVLNSLTPTSKYIMSKVYNVNKSSNLPESVLDTITSFRNTLAHSKYDLAYVISGQRVQDGEKAGYYDLANSDAVLNQEQFKIIRNMGSKKNNPLKQNQKQNLNESEIDELEEYVYELYRKLEADIPLENYIVLMENNHGNEFRGVIGVEELILLATDLSRVLDEKSNVSFDLEKSAIINKDTNKTTKLNANTKELIDSFINYYGAEEFGKLDQKSKDYILKRLISLNAQSTTEKHGKGIKKTSVDIVDYKLEDSSMGTFCPITIDYLMGIHKFAKDIKDGKLNLLVNSKRTENGLEYEVSLSDIVHSILKTNYYMKNSGNDENVINTNINVQRSFEIDANENYTKIMALKELVYFQLFLEKGVYNGKIYEGKNYQSELSKKENADILDGLENTVKQDEDINSSVKRYRNIFMHARMKPDFMKYFRTVFDLKKPKDISSLEVECIDMNEEKSINKKAFKKTY